MYVEQRPYGGFVVCISSVRFLLLFLLSILSLMHLLFSMGDTRLSCAH